MRRSTHRREAGVTLIELMIAITLVALLSGSLLMALRTGFLAFTKTGDRLRSNRRQINIEKILASQISGTIPVVGGCGGSFFSGSQSTLRLVSTYSIAEGSRGLPRVILFQVMRGENGGLRLIVNEFLYTGSASTLPFCGAVGAITPASFVAADGLASCGFSYLESIPDSVKPGNWVGGWNRPNLPAAVRIDMTPLVSGPGQLTIMPVTAPIRITREMGAPYEDVQ